MKNSKLIRSTIAAIAAVSTIAFTQVAAAADLPRKAYSPPPPPPVFNWTGCYLGGYVGAAWRNRDTTFSDLGNSQFLAYSGGITNPRREGPHSWDASLDDNFIGGGTLGCNWQPVGSAFVFGIEGEAGYMKLKGSAFDPLISSSLPLGAVRGTADVLGSVKVGDWHGMITGRLGYAWGTTMIYIKGGAAFVPVQASVLDQCAVTAAGCGNWLISTSNSSTITTGTLGGGIEWAFASNWSVKGEYMFIGLGNQHVSTCGLATSASGTIIGGGQFCFDHEFRGIHTAKIGLNYRFY